MPPPPSFSTMRECERVWPMSEAVAGTRGEHFTAGKESIQRSETNRAPARARSLTFRGSAYLLKFKDKYGTTAAYRGQKSRLHRGLRRAIVPEGLPFMPPRKIHPRRSSDLCRLLEAARKAVHPEVETPAISKAFRKIIGSTSSARCRRYCEFVLSLFLQAGQPATTTPDPPSAIEGGFSTKVSHTCFCNS